MARERLEGKLFENGNLVSKECKTEKCKGTPINQLPLSISQSYPKNFFHYRVIFPLFTIKLGHFIVDFFIYYKHSSESCGLVGSEDGSQSKGRGFESPVY